MRKTGTLSQKREYSPVFNQKEISKHTGVVFRLGYAYGWSFSVMIWIIFYFHPLSKQWADQLTFTLMP